MNFELECPRSFTIEEARRVYMRSPSELLKLSCPSADSIIMFIKSKAKRAVIGMSGGVDSSLVATLAVRALGKENVFALMLPAGNHPDDLSLAVEHANMLGIEYKAIDLSSIVKECAKCSDAFEDKLQLGNLKARLRMTHLYAYARKFGGVVLGTGNRSEIMVGYFTKFGDGGSDILPIAQLYKAQVWSLARLLKVPEAIVSRPPTAGLWQGQTDEEELGMKYSELDAVLLGLELELDPGCISSVTNVPREKIDAITRMIESSRHKRELAPMPKPKFAENTESQSARNPKKHITLTVDAIIKHNGKYVLVRRGREPYKGMFVFPGGHVDYGESVENAVVREVMEETSLEFEIKGLLGVYSKPKRDPRGHYATVVFYGEGKGTLRAGDDACEINARAFEEMGSFGFDHDEIWNDYVRWVGK